MAAKQLSENPFAEDQFQRKVSTNSILKELSTNVMLLAEKTAVSSILVQERLISPQRKGSFRIHQVRKPKP